MYKAFLSFFFLGVVACQSNSGNATINRLPIITKQPHIKEIKCDTTINYNIDSFSSEGVEIKACYLNKQLVRAEISLYGSAGRNDLIYLILNDSIIVNEKKYTYNVALSEVRHNSDIKLKDSSSYIISLSKRKVIQGNSDSNKLHILSLFLNNVQQKLK